VIPICYNRCIITLIPLDICIFTKNFFRLFFHSSPPLLSHLLSSLFFHLFPFAPLFFFLILFLSHSSMSIVRSVGCDESSARRGPSEPACQRTAHESEFPAANDGPAEHAGTRERKQSCLSSYFSTLMLLLLLGDDAAPAEHAAASKQGRSAAHGRHAHDAR
jgi:hypothetical protein